MSNYVIGIDPGVTGAISLLKDGDLKAVADIPHIVKPSGRGKEINIFAFNDLLSGFIEKNPELVIIENQQATSTNGSVGSFSQGQSFGIAKALVASYGLNYKLVTPVKWKNYYQLEVDKKIKILDSHSKHEAHEIKKQNQKIARINKNKYRVHAINLFPHFEYLLKLVKHTDRADAALIGLYGFSLI